MDGPGFVPAWGSRVRATRGGRVTTTNDARQGGVLLSVPFPTSGWLRAHPLLQLWAHAFDGLYQNAHIKGDTRMYVHTRLGFPPHAQPLEQQAKRGRIDTRNVSTWYVATNRSTGDRWGEKQPQADNKKQKTFHLSITVQQSHVPSRQRRLAHAEHLVPHRPEARETGPDAKASTHFNDAISKGCAVRQCSQAVSRFPRDVSTADNWARRGRKRRRTRGRAGIQLSSTLINPQNVSTASRVLEFKLGVRSTGLSCFRRVSLTRRAGDKLWRTNFGIIKILPSTGLSAETRRRPALSGSFFGTTLEGPRQRVIEIRISNIVPDDLLELIRAF